MASTTMAPLPPLCVRAEYAAPAIDPPPRRRRRRRRRTIRTTTTTRCSSRDEDNDDTIDDDRQQTEEGGEHGTTAIHPCRDTIAAPTNTNNLRVNDPRRRLLPSLLLQLLLLALRPIPTTGTLYVHTTSSSNHNNPTTSIDQVITIPYPSEPARFGRVFDGTITGPGNLFLPPWGIDGRLCSVAVADTIEDGKEGMGARAADAYDYGDVYGDGNGEGDVSDDVHADEGGVRRLDHRRYRPHHHNRRRLLDQMNEEGATPAVDMDYAESPANLRHRYLLASSGGDNPALGGGGNGDHKDVGGDGDAIRRSRNHPPQQRRDLHGPYTDDGTYLSSSSSSSSRYSSATGLDLDLTQPRPIALLVERGGCTFHEKARNAMRLNRRLVREAVRLGREGYGRTDDDNGGGDGGGDTDIGDDEEEDGANRKRVYEFPGKGDADVDNANDGDDTGGTGGRRRAERRMASHRILQTDANNDNDNTYDQDTIIEQGLDSVQRDMDKSEVGTARPSDLIGDGGSSLGGYGNGSNNNNVFVELPTLRIDYLVVYNDEVNSAYGKEDDLVLMDRPSNTQDVDRVDVGLVFVSRRSGLDLWRRMDELSSTEQGTTVPWPSGLTTDYDKHESDGDGEDGVPAYYLNAIDMFPSTATKNGGWFLPISVDQKKELGPYGTTGWPRASTPRDSFYWIRFVLIALLIVTPVMRGCFVWHGAGGRVQFRRNDAGRIVGLHIVRPSGSWITGWDDGAWEEGDAERQRDRIRKMTQDEVMGLPEIEYAASTDEDADEGNDEDEDGDDDGDDGDDLEAGEDTGSKREDLADISISSSDSHPQEPEASGVESASSSDNSPATKTTCTSCSICIDDFEPGEKIRLLPRCGHAFHTDCILPWLTERSGSCPLCKRNVMGDGSDGLEENSSDEDGLNSTIDGDDAEERAIENEDEDVEQGRAGSRQRPQDSRVTRESISSSSSNGAIQTSSSARTRRARRRRRNGLDAGA